MEKDYMSLIWKVVGSKENQHLSVKEQQDKIEELLHSMKKDVESFTKNAFKKECLKAVENSLKTL